MGKEDFWEMVGLGKWASAESRGGSGQWQERGPGMGKSVEQSGPQDRGVAVC